MRNLSVTFNDSLYPHAHCECHGFVLFYAFEQPGRRYNYKFPVLIVSSSIGTNSLTNLTDSRIVSRRRRRAQTQSDQVWSRIEYWHSPELQDPPACRARHARVPIHAVSRARARAQTRRPRSHQYYTPATTTAFHHTEATDLHKALLDSYGIFRRSYPALPYSLSLSLSTVRFCLLSSPPRFRLGPRR